MGRHKNECGDLGVKSSDTLESGVHPPVCQYPLNPGAVQEMDLIVQELSTLGVVRKELNPSLQRSSTMKWTALTR